MELLLNLAWLLLALPAYWLWRECKVAAAHRKLSSGQCLFALTCMLVILFPVVSATDDLHAMRTEMEESPASKRNLSQKSQERTATAKWQPQPSVPAVLFQVEMEDCGWSEPPVASLLIPSSPCVRRCGRAPPQLLA